MRILMTKRKHTKTFECMTKRESTLETFEYIFCDKGGKEWTFLPVLAKSVFHTLLTQLCIPAAQAGTNMHTILKLMLTFLSLSCWDPSKDGNLCKSLSHTGFIWNTDIKTPISSIPCNLPDTFTIDIAMSILPCHCVQDRFNWFWRTCYSPVHNWRTDWF